MWYTWECFVTREYKSVNIFLAASHDAKCCRFSYAWPQHRQGSPVEILRTSSARCSTFLKCEPQSRGVSSLVLYLPPMSFGSASILSAQADRHDGSTLASCARKRVYIFAHRFYQGRRRDPRFYTRWDAERRTQLSLPLSHSNGLPLAICPLAP